MPADPEVEEPISYLRSIVRQKIADLGPAGAAVYFGVSESLVRQWAGRSKQIPLTAVERVFGNPDLADGANWDGKQVYLCLPQYKQTNPLTLWSILGIWDRDKFGALLEFGDAFIVHSREILATRFVESNKEWSLWIDDDMVVPMGNAQWFKLKTGWSEMPDEFAGLNTANRLLSHKRTLVGGLYFGRVPHGRAMYYEAMVATEAGAEENRRAHAAPIDELKAVRWTGTGCLLVHRSVFTDIRAANPHLEPTTHGETYHWFTNASDGVMSRMGEIRQIVTDAATAAAEDQSMEAVRRHLAEADRILRESLTDNRRNSHLMQGEDQTFGIRAGAAGHQSFVDLGLVCGHIGTAIYGPYNTNAPHPRYRNN